MDKTNNDGGVTQLLPCPFCGGAVVLEQTVEAKMRKSPDWWGVVCRNTENLGGTCAIEQIPSRSKESAIARWNTPFRQQAITQHERAQPGKIVNETVAGIPECDVFVVERFEDGWAVQTMEAWKVLAQHEGDEKPVAWMYENESGDRTFEFNPNGESARWLIEHGYTETPLYAHAPATRPAALVEGEVEALGLVIAKALYSKDLDPFDNPELHEFGVEVGKSVLSHLSPRLTQRDDEVARLQSERDAAVAEVARLREAVVQYNEALRSAKSIADRNGAETNWTAFRGRLTYTLAEYHELVNEARHAHENGDASHAE